MNDDNKELDLSSLGIVFEEKEVKALEKLYDAILTMNNREEMHKFFLDLLSANELCSMIHRWQIVELIDEGKRYEEIIHELAPENEEKSSGTERETRKGKGRNKTKVSSATISRVKNCYNNPDGGYRTALTRLNNK